MWYFLYPRGMHKSIAFHITAKTPDKAWFALALQDAWPISHQALARSTASLDFELIAFVLMSNHYHLLAKLPFETLQDFVQGFHEQMRPSLIFEQSFYWCPIFSRQYLAHCYKYIYQNPLRAGIVDRCENYPYSTLHTLVHQKNFPLQIYDRFGIKDEFCLRWINQGMSLEALAEQKSRPLQSPL